MSCAPEKTGRQPPFLPELTAHLIGLLTLFTKSEKFKGMTQDLKPFCLQDRLLLGGKVFLYMNIFHAMTRFTNQMMMMFKGCELVTAMSVLELYETRDALRLKKVQFAIHGHFI